jgi:ribose transport system substrate-binding protein
MAHRAARGLTIKYRRKNQRKKFPREAFKMQSNRKHALATLLAIGVLASGAAVSAAKDGPPGITKPTVFAPFNPDAPACAAPPDLGKVLAFAQDNEREFMQGVDHGLAMAAKDRKLEYRRAVANNDAAKMVEQVQLFLASKVGAVIAAPVDPASLSHSLQEVMWAGGLVSTIVPPPATSLLNVPQYLTGKTLGDTAAAYIKTSLGGKANVVLLTQDSIEFLAPRFAALRDSMKTVPGVTIVADISPNPVNKEGGFATMSTILQAHPDIDVVLGADTVVLGALAALEAAGKARPNQFLGGIDGEPEAVAQIKKGGGPYKASIALSSPVFGYAMGQHAADWLEGKSVPQAMDVLPSALTSQNIAQYETDLANPAAVYADKARRDAYLKMYGNICYDTRDQYVNFPWSSETK